jgi:hypothetical protein
MKLQPSTIAAEASQLRLSDESACVSDMRMRDVQQSELYLLIM